MAQLTRQFLPGYFRSRLAALFVHWKPSINSLYILPKITLRYCLDSLHFRL